MAKAQVIEEAQFRHAIKVAAVTGQTPARDVAILCVLYGTGMTATELAQLEVADVLAESGAFRRESEVRPAIAFVSKAGRSTGPTCGSQTRLTPTLPRGCGSGTARLSGGRSGAAWRSSGRPY